MTLKLGLVKLVKEDRQSLELKADRQEVSNKNQPENLKKYCQRLLT
jgi:hypothetical protein